MVLLVSALSLGPLSTLALRKVSCEGEDEWSLGGISFGRLSSGFISGDNPSICLQPGCVLEDCTRDNVNSQH